MRLLPVIASLTAVAALTVLAVGPVRAEGVGPCISAANQGYHDCKGGCRESFQLTKDTCANRDHVCVESCRTDRQGCRQPILNTFNTALAASDILLEQDVANCRVLYGNGTTSAWRTARRHASSPRTPAAIAITSASKGAAPRATYVGRRS